MGKTKIKHISMAAVACALILSVMTAGVVRLDGNSETKTSKKGQMPEVRTTAVQSGDIKRIVSVSGAVKSTDSENIYSALAYQIKKVYVDVGDAVKVGDVLAELDTDSLNYDIRQAESSYESAVNSVSNEQVSLSNAVTNAKTALEQAQLALERQQLVYNRALEDTEKFAKDNSASGSGRELVISAAKLNSERRATDLANAKKDLADAKKDLDKAINNFDDYTFANGIKDAKDNVDRQTKNLADAKKDLADAAVKGFDGYSGAINVNNALADAQKAVKDLEKDVSNAKSELRAAENNASIPGTYSIYLAAKDKLETLEKKLDAANITLERAEKAVVKANEDYADGKDDKTEALKRSVTTYENALDDANKAYKRAVDNRDRARDDEIDAYQKKYDSMERAYDSADNLYKDALRGYTDALDANDKNLASEAKALENAKLNVKSAQVALRQAEAQSASASADNQEIAVERLNKNLQDSKILATMDGVITESNAKVGANPAGVLFVIEDTESLYVSAKVKEYTVGDIDLGQEVNITTDATSDKVFKGKITYISPKAVSEAGSTSVEFEVWAKFDEPVGKVKIGMNAFIDIITAEKSGVLSVSTGAILAENGQSCIYSYENGAVAKIPVTTGIKTNTVTEISGEGVRAGMTVAADPEDFAADPEDFAADSAGK